MAHKSGVLSVPGCLRNLVNEKNDILKRSRGMGGKVVGEETYEL